MAHPARTRRHLTYQTPTCALLVTMNPWPGRIARALSLRVIALSIIAGIGLGVVVGLIWPAASTWAMWLIAGVTYAVAVFNDGQMTRCDQCSKMVKMGADRCHHCGYTRIAA